VSSYLPFQQSFVVNKLLFTWTLSSIILTQTLTFRKPKFFVSPLTLARGHSDLAGGHGPLWPPLGYGPVAYSVSICISLSAHDIMGSLLFCHNVVVYASHSINLLTSLLTKLTPLSPHITINVMLNIPMHSKFKWELTRAGLTHWRGGLCTMDAGALPFSPPLPFPSPPQPYPFAFPSLPPCPSLSLEVSPLKSS
jgi:hypothetical protein